MNQIRKIKADISFDEPDRKNAIHEAKRDIQQAQLSLMNGYHGLFNNDAMGEGELQALKDICKRLDSWIKNNLNK